VRPVLITSVPPASRVEAPRTRGFSKSNLSDLISDSSFSIRPIEFTATAATNSKATMDVIAATNFHALPRKMRISLSLFLSRRLKWDRGRYRTATVCVAVVKKRNGRLNNRPVKFSKVFANYARTALPSVYVASAISAGTLHPATTHAACMMAPSAPCAMAQLFATPDISKVIALVAVVARWVALATAAVANNENASVAMKFKSSAVASA